MLGYSVIRDIAASINRNKFTKWTFWVVIITILLFTMYMALIFQSPPHHNPLTSRTYTTAYKIL